jgi:hypothetical protein
MMGDNPNRQESEVDQNESSEEEVVIEEYYTYHLPSNLVTADQDKKEGGNLQIENVTDTISKEESKLEHGSGKSKKYSNIKTITRIDEDTDNVVILIRPRRQSGSPSEEEAKYDFSNSTNREKLNLKDKLIQNEVMDKKDVPLNDNRKSCTIEDSRTHNLIIEHRNDMSVKVGKSDEDYQERIILNENLNTNNSEVNNNLESSSSDDFMSTNPLNPEDKHRNNKHLDNTQQESTGISEMKIRYENQGARPKTVSNVVPTINNIVSVDYNMTSEHDRALREMEPPNKIVQKSSGRYGISPEANEKVKKLKEIGKYQDMVKNSHLQRNKGVVHDLVQKINMENIDPEITEEDDILIWKLMKSLKEKTAINERDNNEDKTWSSSVPQEKCDWSYEKATLSKDKYLSRRLQTKEIGQVKIVTFMSPSKENKEVKIKPLKMTRTLPFNVKKIFQQKMDEVKNKKRVCLTGGKDLMFTTVDVDNDCS